MVLSVLTSYNISSQHHNPENCNLKNVLYNILTEFCTPMKLVRLIKMCLNKTFSKVYVHKYLSNAFPIQNSLKEGDVFLL
jgi:hypothetical protein